MLLLFLINVLNLRNVYTIPIFWINLVYRSVLKGESDTRNLSKSLNGREKLRKYIGHCKRGNPEYPFFQILQPTVILAHSYFFAFNYPSLTLCPREKSVKT